MIAMNDEDRELNIMIQTFKVEERIALCYLRLLMRRVDTHPLSMS